MKYINAAEVLPEQLLMEIQKYITGQMIYIPNRELQRSWGERSGAKSFFEIRNKEIKEAYEQGKSIEDISEAFGLAYETIRKIIYRK